MTQSRANWNGWKTAPKVAFNPISKREEKAEGNLTWFRSEMWRWSNVKGKYKKE